MPRTYRYDHFTQKEKPLTRPMSKESRSLKARAKQAVAQSDSKAHQGGKPRISYGKKFAESEQIYKEHHEHYEELHAQDGRTPVIPGKVQPIGALPGMEDPELRADFGHYFDRAKRDVRRMRNAMEDLLSAGGQMLSLPADLVRVALRRFRPA